MTFRMLLVAKAVVALVFGAPLLVAPSALLGLVGATVCAAGLVTAREYGAAMIGTLLLTWFAKGVTAGDARKAILLDLLVYDAIGVAISVAAVLGGAFNALGWGIVIVYLFFTAGSGYVLLRERSARPIPAAASV
jgi:hypothetical protein